MKHIKKFEHYLDKFATDEFVEAYDMCEDCDCSPCQCDEMEESNSWECDCEECDCDNGKCKECDGNCKSVSESRRALLERRLSKKQKTLDKNFNDRIDAEDFEILRRKGKVSKHKCKSCGK